MKPIQEANVYISGGTSGIGLAVAKKYASLGANVFAFSVDDPALIDKAIEEINMVKPDTSQRTQGLQLDVTDCEAVERELTSAAKTFGPPTVLVNSAGIGGAIYFEQLSYERFDRTMKINLYGTRNVVAALLPFMKEQGGHIVNVSSMSGLIGIVGYTAYASSKFAVVGFSQSLRAELKRYGIRVSVLCPAQVDTPMLEKTDKYKPPETKRINDNAGLISAEQVAEQMLKAMEADRFIIVPSARGRFFHLVNRLVPGVREWMTDRLVRKAQQEIANGS